MTVELGAARDFYPESKEGKTETTGVSAVGGRQRQTVDPHGRGATEPGYLESAIRVDRETIYPQL